MAPKRMQQSPAPGSNEDCSYAENEAKLSELMYEPLPESEISNQQELNTGEDKEGDTAIVSVGVATASGTKIVVRLPPRLIRPSENDLEFRRQWIKKYGALLYPEQEMQGIGHYEFLTVYHEAVARFIGLSTPEEVLDARIEERLEWGGDPEIVWYPEKAHVNPSRRPSEAGHWEYYTEYDELEAHMNFGGDQEISMPERLTADELWTLRQRLRGTEREHATDSIRLLWIPDDLYDPPESDRAPSQGDIGLSEIVDRASDAEQLDRERVASEEPDPTPKSDSTQSSQDSTDATNGDPDGPHDQTGAIGKAEYWEVEAEGTKIVVDRSRAQVGSREDHLFTIYTRKGWCQYQRRHIFDWDDRIDVERLNNWRNQTMRPVFGPKRKTGPHEYTNEEIAHLRELGEKERGLRPPGGFEALGKEFERLFGVKRAGSAIGRKYREVYEAGKDSVEDESGRGLEKRSQPTDDGKEEDESSGSDDVVVSETEGAAEQDDEVRDSDDESY